MTTAARRSLAELRLAVGRQGVPLRQRELAERIGAAGAYISQIESGKHRPSQFLLHKIAEVYGMTLDELRAAAAETRRRRDAGEPQISQD